ncbi:MAG TPA: hypothetical protein VFS44_00550 [Gemmatimonadaceae bacterium]|nr:hypothetical protein [Gemmatimonadaceae bacterium]
MKTLDLLKIVLLLVALAIWAWGARTNQNVFMLVGIAFVVVAFLLRFVPKVRGKREEGTGKR